MNILNHDNIHTDIPGKRRIRRLEDEYAKLWKMYGGLEDERDRLRKALEECETDIDNYIDLEKPRGVHPRWDSENTHLKEMNPARLALQEDRDD